MRHALALLRHQYHNALSCFAQPALPPMYLQSVQTSLMLMELRYLLGTEREYELDWYPMYLAPRQMVPAPLSKRLSAPEKQYRLAQWHRVLYPEPEPTSSSLGSFVWVVLGFVVVLYALRQLWKMNRVQVWTIVFVMALW